MEQFVVTFVETDGSTFEGVHAKVMEGETPESVARARVAEAAEYYKRVHEESSDGLKWEEVIYSQLEDEGQMKAILSEMHPYYTVSVFSLSGEPCDLCYSPSQASLQYLIVITDDSLSIEKFQQETAPEPILDTLREWTIKSLGGDEKILSEDSFPHIDKTPDEIRQMSFSELADQFDNYCWGGPNETKIVHVVEVTEKGIRTIV